jgi:hypothetical protein
MYYTPWSLRERSACFDTLKAQGDATLKNPAVMRKLGAYTNELLAAWEGVFLPNVRHNVVSLPNQERFTNGFALLPVRSDEQRGELHIDPSMYEPTRQRRAFYYATGGTRQDMLETVEEHSAERAYKSHLLSHNLRARVVATIFTSPEHLLTSRPLIYARDSFAHYQPLIVGRSVLHETIHGMQVEKVSKQKIETAATSPHAMQAYLCSTESEAYFASATILQEAGYRFDPAVSPNNLIDLEVEALRSQVNTPDTPFRASRDLIRGMVQLGAIPNISQLRIQQ